jgi:hypothetical protein
LLSEKDTADVEKRHRFSHSTLQGIAQGESTMTDKTRFTSVWDAIEDTPQEAEKYDERSLQIASEMFYVFSRIGLN